MSKLGAVAILALATLSSTSAQAAQGDRCHGPEDVEKKACDSGLECVQKDEWYGQCRPVGDPIPDDWAGTIVEYGEAMEEVDAEAPGMGTEMDDEYDLMMEDEPLDDEVDAMAVPAGDVKYMAIIAKDYIPSTEMPNLVMVEDIEDGGSLVENQMECEAECTKTPGCNAASYYLDGSALGDRNCWLKTLADSCELPSDALDDPNAVLLLQIDETCDGTLAALGPMSGFAEGPLAMGPMSDAEGPIGMAPRSIDPLDVPDEPATGTDPTGGSTQSPITGVTPPTVETDPSSGADVSVRGTMIVLAVAGAAAAFF